jgi:hypothetical protein
LIPLVTTVVAANLAGEQITLNFVIGGAFVLMGVLFGALLTPKPQKSEPESEPAEVKEVVLPSPTCH